jgi:hypothetical protein
MAILVGNTVVLIEEPEVDERLLGVFGATRDELLMVARAAVAARNDSVPDDPINAPGQFAYIYGTRGVRMLFRPKGYVTDRRDNIESVVHPKTRIRVIYQNTDTAAQPFRSPKAISDKGSAVERMIDLAEPFLFPDMEEERRIKLEEAKRHENETVWFLCVASDETGIWVEISRPRRLENHQFSEFIERIILLQGGDVPPPQLRYDDEPEQEYEIVVSRK